MEQRSQEWFEARKLHLTASHAQTIQANGKGLETYIFSLVAEKFALTPEEHYTNKDIERGVELEEQARLIYELEKGVEVEEVGFLEMGKHVGASPDGLIGKDGGLEIKCVNNTNFVKAKINGLKGIDKGYYWQCMMSIIVSGRTWWDLAIYNESFKDSLLVFRIEKNDKDIEKLEKGLKDGKGLLSTTLKSFKK